MWAMWNLVSVRLETVLVSAEDRSMVCVKCTIGSEIILDTPDGTLW
jgi:adenine C2-methylase RlmN of 23S rRNA A2503 and tRNA A37